PAGTPNGGETAARYRLAGVRQQAMAAWLKDKAAPARAPACARWLSASHPTSNLKAEEAGLPQRRHSGTTRRVGPGIHEHGPLENGFRARRCAAPRNDDRGRSNELQEPEPARCGPL